MSLINQMLQDLDARRVAHGADSGLPGDVRPLPPARRPLWPVVLGGSLLLASAAGMAWFFLARPESPPAFVNAAPGPTQVPSVAPATVPLAVEPAPAAAPVVDPVLPPPAVAGSGSESTVLRELDGSLRLSERLNSRAATMPNKLAREVPAERATTSSRPDPGVRAATPAPAELPAVRAASSVLEDNKTTSRKGLIEKTEPVTSARERAEVEYRKAILAVNQGRLPEAEEQLRAALRHDSLHIASRQLLVRLLLEAKKSDQALRVLQDGLHEQPAQLGWAMSLARLFMERGDVPAAWGALEQALPAASGNADFQGFAGHLLQRQGRHREAATHYAAAARLATADGRWWLGLGLAFEADGRAAEAREAFLRARQSGTLAGELAVLVEQKLR